MSRINLMPPSIFVNIFKQPLQRPQRPQLQRLSGLARLIRSSLNVKKAQSRPNYSRNTKYIHHHNNIDDYRGQLQLVWNWKIAVPSKQWCLPRLAQMRLRQWGRLRFWPSWQGNGSICFSGRKGTKGKVFRLRWMWWSSLQSKRWKKCSPNVLRLQELGRLQMALER